MFLQSQCCCLSNIFSEPLLQAPQCRPNKTGSCRRRRRCCWCRDKRHKHLEFDQVRCTHPGRAWTKPWSCLRSRDPSITPNARKYLQTAIFSPNADISAMEPAVFVNRQCSQVLVLEVALRDVVTAENDLTSSKTRNAFILNHFLAVLHGHNTIVATVRDQVAHIWNRDQLGPSSPPKSCIHVPPRWWWVHRSDWMCSYHPRNCNKDHRRSRSYQIPDTYEFYTLVFIREHIPKDDTKFQHQVFCQGSGAW